MPPTEQAFETYTPCYDWVIQATGCQATALTYGVVWRYAQMSGARCYASCERLAGHLAWSRKSVLRHLQRLLALGLIVCANPGVPGVTREYRPVSRERWMAAHGTAGPLAPSRAAAPPDSDDAGEPTAPPAVMATGVVSSGAGAVIAEPLPSPGLSAEPIPTADTPAGPDTREPVPSADTPCDNLDQGPVPNGDTRNTIRNTSKIQVGTAGRRDPRIVLLRKLTGRMPPAILRAQVLAALGPSPAAERLTECYRAWCARGYNPMNYA
ncbi:MAG: helix-turn-helix domain-containing protein [Anaerolineae bacterium]